LSSIFIFFSLTTATSHSVIPLLSLHDALPIYSYARPLGSNEHNGTRFNAAFSIGSGGSDVRHGAACAILTIEAMTDIYIDDWARSEEHTSELQSRFDLVCRLLLEKKKYYENT